jgi:uncharacterized membrane protein
MPSTLDNLDVGQVYNTMLDKALISLPHMHYLFVMDLHSHFASLPMQLLLQIFGLITSFKKI